MKKTIGILTATRAEFGLLRPIIDKLRNSDSFDVQVLVTGAHLSKQFGNTYLDIEEAGIPIAIKIPILADYNDTAERISLTMANALAGFSVYFSTAKLDALLVLGDRYETLAVSIAAMNANIPIFHLYGGETTEGAIDEAIRHSITKMSYLHFTSTEENRKRVIQLGEDPSRVFTVGAMGVENALKLPLLSKEEITGELSLDSNHSYALVTFHPVTLESNTAEQQLEELLGAIDAYPDIQFVFTGSNADAGGTKLNERIQDYVSEHSNTSFHHSLGNLRYLSAVKYCAFVMGNSSSGIIEVPSFHVPTINIGDRQKGRLQADSTINVEPDKESIAQGIQKASSKEFKDSLVNVVNPYGDGNTSAKIVEIIEQQLTHPINLKKKFYDVQFDIDGEKK